MSSLNQTERKRISQRFAGFYLVSLGLMGVIFAAFFSREPAAVAGSSTASGSNLRIEQERILLQSANLETAFKTLLQYDDEYNKLIGQPGSSKGMADINNRIRTTEATLAKQVDQLNKSKNLYRFGNNSKLIENIASIYTVALQSRSHLRDARSLVGNGDNKAPAEQELLRVTAQLNSREQELIALRNEESNNGSEPQATLAPEALVKENESLRNSVAESKQKAEQATEQTTLLKKENAKLVEKLNDVQRVVPSARADAAESSKIKSLSADLSFSQVDCNLTRADAKQIISNSRQRRELLNEALTILNNLTKSENAEIRKKAADKIAALNYIAKNIRE